MNAVKPINPTQSKSAIQTAIKVFSSGSLTNNALSLFQTLGYNTERQDSLAKKTFAYFKNSFLDGETRFNEDKAKVTEWKTIDRLFQLTEDEIAAQTKIFDTKKVDNTIIEAYLFFAIELAQPAYSRTVLAQITREINKVFPMPVMVVFKYGGYLTISVINRRLHKKDEQKDVLEKVTLIKDISIANPHRAHVEILFDLSFEQLKQVHKFTNFVELHNAWQKTLDTKELNKRFYHELSNWYFWAVNHVSFPNDIDDDKDNTVFNSESVIRLLTRLIFIWFIKEKNLIPETIFNEQEVKQLLKNFKAEGSNVYYRAILQNLFFATLNQKIEERDFASKGSFTENKKNYGVKTLYRYEDEFNIEKNEIIALFSGVPFLNGGLFDCLDRPDKKDRKGKVLYLDGFSRNENKQAKVPDMLFFSKEQTIDLSGIYGDKKKKNEKVKGLFEILNNYKFTVTENTPIEEEIALDPELLGKVFENLLASYNPETKTTARKQTGSFYTPREIVNYMVDESLIAYLAKNLTPEQGGEVLLRLRSLLSYSETPNLFTPEETRILIHAIDTCKIIDPACGSGAFPMGILHKMVHILHKLDPDNKGWKDLQRKKAVEETEEAFRIGNKQEREKRLIEINDVFDQNINEPDYARKLYLIENCIYGIDIQPIAVQIAKLRFFISLVIDQKKNPEKENFGVRSLPNLETKFVAANTLIGIEKPGQLLIKNSKIEKLEQDLRQLRHKYFTAKTRNEKLDYQKYDENLRHNIAKLLIKDKWENKEAEQMAAFDPYDQNSFAPFFDPEWMFAIKNGFDIVLGNPPYVQLQKQSGKLADMFKKCRYKTFERTGDIYALFYENGLNMLKPGGHLCFITSNKWMRAGYGKSLRSYFLTKNPKLLIDLGPGVFESATVDTNILIIQNADNNYELKGLSLSDEAKDTDLAEYANQNAVSLPKMTSDSWFIGSNAEQKLKEKIESIGKPLKEWDVKIYFGIKTGLNEAFIIDNETKDRLCKQDPKSAEILKPILRGRDIKRYGYEWAGLWLIASGFDIEVPKIYPAIFKHLKRFEEKAKKRDDKGKNWWNLRACAYYPEFEKEKVVWKRIGSVLRFGFDTDYMYCQDSTCIMTGNKLKYLCAFMNSKLSYQMLYDNAPKTGTGDVIVSVQALEPLLIPPITPKNRHIVNKIEKLVDRILAKKKKKADTAGLEREIDEMVYELYGLTEEEIGIVEGGKK